MKIVITQEDVKNSRSFSDQNNCPFATVMKKVLNDPDAYVGNFVVISFGQRVGEINPPFYQNSYDKLISGEIKEFVTEYTPL